MPNISNTLGIMNGKYIFRILRKSFLFLSLIYFTIIFCSCVSNKYAEYYVENTNVDGQYSVSEKTPKLIEIEDTDEIYDWEQNGYCVIGSSIFYSTWAPRTRAIDCARKYGASHVLVIFKQGEIKHKTATFNMPTANTTYHYGTFLGTYGNANYSGTSTTYGVVPVTINYMDQYYSQGAFFLAKRSRISPYGVYLAILENTQNKKGISVYVAVVIKNSIADKKGIRRGDCVKKINGKLIVSTEQVQEFIRGTKEIEDLEVRHE